MAAEYIHESDEEEYEEECEPEPLTPKLVALIAASVAFVGGGSIAAILMPDPAISTNVSTAAGATAYVNETQLRLVLAFLIGGVGSALIIGAITFCVCVIKVRKT